MRQTLLVLFAALPLCLSAVLLLWSHRRRTRLKKEAAGPTVHVVRTVELNSAGREGTRSPSAATGLALLPLAATALLLRLHWNDIPARFPIHWGFDGQPNGWSSRTPLGVFGPLALAAVLIAFFLLMDVLTGRYSPGFTGRTVLLRVKRGALTGAAWLTALLISAGSGLPLLKDPSRWIPLFAVASVSASLTLVLVVVYRSLRVPPAVVAASRQTTGDRFWKAGLIYYNPGDGAMMVPKRDGLGYTMNFGRPIAWVLTAAVLLLAVLFPLLFHLSSRH